MWTDQITIKPKNDYIFYINFMYPFWRSPTYTIVISADFYVCAIPQQCQITFRWTLFSIVISEFANFAVCPSLFKCYVLISISCYLFCLIDMLIHV